MDGHAPPEELVVMQNGVRVAVDLMLGRHTGLFLDMRIIRGLLAPHYKNGGAMLNLFCYSGMFSVHGLKNGLSSVLNLDLAKTALERARRNYGLNGIACDERDFMYGDALTWMKAFAKKGRRFDFVILDPPTFARSKQGSFSVKKDFPCCLDLLSSLAPGGLALTVVNSPAVSQKQYRQWHPASWELEWLEHEPDDFPCVQQPYLKAGLWKIPC
jgi:23S rRNA (cytosine1962-C5)-methyltransferase